MEGGSPGDGGGGLEGSRGGGGGGGRFLGWYAVVVGDLGGNEMGEEVEKLEREERLR